MSIAQQIGKASLDTENRTRAGEFISLVKYLGAAGGNFAEAHEAAVTARANERVQSMLKAAVSAGTTSNMSVLFDYRQAVGAFLASISNSAFDQMLSSFMRMPLHTRVAITTTAVTGYRVSEQSSKPVSSIALANSTLEPIKVAAQVIMTRELLRAQSAAASQLVANELRAAIAAITDSTFFSLILTGISATPSSGGGVAQVRADLTTALDALSTGASSKIFFVMSSAVANRLSLMGDTAGNAAFAGMTPQGGLIGGITTLVSDGLPSNYIIVLDASQIAVGDEGLRVDVSQQATLQMDSAPDSPPVASTSLVGLWQSNLTATRLERYLGAERLRTTAVAAISNVNYSGNSPA
jgi:hypothetical protein